MIQVSIPVKRKKRFSKASRLVVGVHLTSFLVGPGGGYFPKESNQDADFTTYLHLVPSWRTVKKVADIIFNNIYFIFFPIFLLSRLLL
jgi:hypothetical protein